LICDLPITGNNRKQVIEKGDAAEKSVEGFQVEVEKKNMN